jgi:hypothetical protein
MPTRPSHSLEHLSNLIEQKVSRIRLECYKTLYQTSINFCWKIALLGAELGGDI